MKVKFLLYLIIAFMLAVHATEITRQQAYNAATRTNGVSQHTSTVNDVTVTFQYITVASSNFNNPGTYTAYDQAYNSTQWSGVFGNYYTYQQTTMGWSDSSNGSYSSIEGYKLLPVAGKSMLSMSGFINTDFFNSRPLTETSTIDWKILYASTGSFSNAVILDSGSFQVKRFSDGQNKTEFISGDNTLNNLVVQDFTQGYIAFLVKNTYSNPSSNGGHVNIMDSFTYNFSAVPEIHSIMLLVVGIILIKWIR